MFGISAALTTPLSTDGDIDLACLQKHIHSVLSAGCSSVTFFGTTGEGASFSASTRLATVRAMINGGLAPGQLVLTVHGSAAEEIINQVTAARKMGVSRFLLPPPCYFNAPPVGGLSDWFERIFSRFEGTDAQFILYHIPQVIGVGLPVEMVAQLKTRHPDLVFGVKDSSGSFENTQNLLKLSGLEILVGDESLLASCVQLGASGAISGIANLFPERLVRVLASGVDDPDINRLVDILSEFPVTPAIKALVAYRYSDETWRRSAPPLAAIGDKDYTALGNIFDLVGKS